MSAHPATLTPHASALHFFGAELRHLRLRAGLSQRALAPRVLASWTLIGKVETAERFPSLDLAERCDRELDAGGALIRLHGLVVAERAAPAPGPAAHPEEALATLLRALALAAESVTGTRRPSAPQIPDVLDRIDAALRATVARSV